MAMTTRTSQEPFVVDTEKVAAIAPAIRRTSLDEYHRMIDAGILGDDDPVELVDGLILTLSPQKPAHALVIEGLTDAASTGLPSGVRVRCQLPLTLRDSEPEPDIAFVPGTRSSSTGHPGHAALVIEVAGESLARDRLLKGPIYARAGIPECVIADVSRKRLEVFREPAPEN